MPAHNITPPADFFDLYATVTLAEQFGWERQDAFIVAMLLRSNGVNAVEALRLFRDAGRWVQ
jgi:hypothetical protein